MDPEFETRKIADDEFRADPEEGTFAGLASAFRFVDDWATAFLKGAFRKTINDHKLDDGASKIPTVWFHNSEQLVGPTRSLKEGPAGMEFRSLAVDDGHTGSMVRAQMRAGTHLGMSFSFRRIKDRTAEPADGVDLSTGPSGIKLNDVRVITEAAVREISVLPWTFAAQPMATITDIRSRLPHLMDAIRAGSLSDRDRVLIAQIVDAWNERAAAGSDDHGTPVEARRRIDVELDMLLLELGEAA